MGCIIVRTSHFPESLSSWRISVGLSTLMKDKILFSTESSRGPFDRGTMKLRMLDGSTVTLESFIQVTCNLPNLMGGLRLSTFSSLFHVCQIHLPGMLSWFILQPWRVPHSCGAVTVRVKDFDGVDVLEEFVRTWMKSWTSELFRTFGYQWPWPGSSRKLTKTICTWPKQGRTEHSRYVRRWWPWFECGKNFSGMPHRNIFIIPAKK